MDVGLVDLGITEDFLNWLQGAAEEILAELFEVGTGGGNVEVDAIKECVNFDGSLTSRGERSQVMRRRRRAWGWWKGLIEIK